MNIAGSLGRVFGCPPERQQRPCRARLLRGTSVGTGTNRVPTGPGGAEDAGASSFGGARRRTRSARRVATAIAPLLLILLPAPSLRAEAPPPPDAAAVVAAWTPLQTWLDAFDPPDPQAEAARVPLPGAEAVCVIVRIRGRVIGTGTASRVEVEEDRMLRLAAGRSFSEALGDGVIASLRASRDPEIDRLLGSRLTVELEVAGPMVPLPGRTWRDVAAPLEPGLDGLAVRRGSAVALRFPSMMLATGTADRIPRLFAALATEVGAPGLEPADLRAREGAVVARFRTLHLAQRAPGRPPFDTLRGQVVIPGPGLDRDGLVSLGDGIVRRLILSLRTEADPIGLPGDYDPIADRYLEERASRRDQALVAAALARYAAAPGPRPGDARRTAEAAAVLLDLLAARLAAGIPDEAEDRVVAAPTLLACDALDGAGSAEIAALADAATARLAELASPQSPGSLLSGHDWAVAAAAAAARLAGEHPEALPAEAVRRLADRAWNAVPEDAAITLLPWIAAAERDLAAATGMPIARQELLRGLFVTLDALRLGTDGPRDLQGGFVLGPMAEARIDAQTVRPAAFFALALRLPSIVPPEHRAEAMERHRRTMRFIRQLAVGDEMLWAFRSPTRSLGGIRAATWVPLMPLAAQAMALEAITETLRSLESAP